MSRIDNLETVFDRIDWHEFAKQKRLLLQFAASMNKETKPNPRLKYPEFAAQQNKLIQDFMNWITALEDAARMDGYQVRHLTEEETTR